MDATAARADGRTARSRRTNISVVDALLSLIEEGELRPPAARIAERAGVSLRTVFHHFDDLESLYAIAAERQLQRVAALAMPMPESGPLAVRIEAFVAARSAALEMVAPVRRAAVLNEPFSPTLAGRLRWARDRARDEVAAVFAKELDRDPRDRRELLSALSAISEWTTWEALRIHQGLSVVQARRVVARTIAALLAEAS